jgi:glycosyltransferase involved in cell wall biosynthesis
MRLLFITENHPPDRGGMAESSDRIVRGLVRAGAAVDLVHFDRRSATASHRATGSGSLTRVPPDADVPHALNLLWNRLQQTVDLRAVTHVIAFGGSLPMLAAPVFAAWMERPLVTLLRGNELDLGIFDPRRRPVLDDAMRRSAAVCTVTTAQARKIAALHPDVTPHVVANGIDLELWQATDADRARAAAWRAEHVLPERRVLGFFGHLKNKKGVPFFVDALLRSGLADRFHLLLIGEVDDELQALLQQVPAFDVLPAVDRFALLPFYLACDFIGVPSHYDGFPNVVIEAMALALPLLASAVGGVEDLMQDGEAGLLFPPGDVHACRRAIVRAAGTSEEELQTLGANAAALVRRRCDAAEETRRYLEVLTAVQEVFDAQAVRGSGSGSAVRQLWQAQ